jgi:O-antigen/teichoic acid export membrane protein
VLLGALATLLIWATADVIAGNFFPGLQLAPLLRVGALTLLTGGLLAFSHAILEAESQFERLSVLNAAQTLLRAALVLILVATVLTATGLLLVEATVPLLIFLGSLALLPKSYLGWPLAFGRHLRRLFRFSRWIAVAAVASLIVARLDLLFLSAFADAGVVGWYAAAVALAAALDLVKTPVLTTSFPDACRRRERSELRAYVRSSLRLTLGISLALLPLFVLSRPLIGLLYGNAYLAAVPAFYLLLLAFLLGLNSEPVAYVLYPLNRPQWIAAGDVLLLVVTIAAGPFLIQRYSMMGAAGLVLLRRTIGVLLTGALVAYALREQPAKDRPASRTGAP